MARSRRTERVLEYRARGQLTESFSPQLLAGAHALLAAGLEERRGGVWREPQNHYSRYAPGTIVLAFTALDAWLVEYALDVTLFDKKPTPLLELSARERFDELVRRSERRRVPAAVRADMATLADLRDEIVHFMPRTPASGQRMPRWFRRLDTQGLLIHARRPGRFTFLQQLGSYALAWWALDVTDRIAQALLQATALQHRTFVEPMVWNFRRFRSGTSPLQLPEYDRRHGLTLSHASS